MAERLTTIDELQAEYRTNAVELSREAAVRNALASVDPHADDDEQSYAVIVRRLHSVLQRIIESDKA